ncbi:TPA: hypothetical protein ACN343_003664 [Vibrio parahaemolyticus]|uniref:hypothetical protein n=1 Tax=Vibrio parahaemolyticus TaxID=670 RepID=UPI0004A4894F|nr:hypothetical protein [Vibrio parahaemolyticus]EIU7622132.1 hypothetical protein [Vibrio parahaemolyticus]MCC3833574.1 hypothetical protein [Vibrio parahaemolyticus]
MRLLDNYEYLKLDYDSLTCVKSKFLEALKKENVLNIDSDANKFELLSYIFTISTHAVAKEDTLVLKFRVSTKVFSSQKEVYFEFLMHPNGYVLPLDLPEIKPAHVFDRHPMLSLSPGDYMIKMCLSFFKKSDFFNVEVQPHYE